MELELLRESEFGEVKKFLASVFECTEDQLHSDAFWRWKCTEPHPFWPEGRGFVRRSSGKIVAYGGLIPLRFLTTNGTVRSGHIIDWAAARGTPGVGLRLYKRVAEMAGGAIGIGGAKITRELLPLLGATKHQFVYSFQRMVNPAALALKGKLDWKTPARFARNLRYAILPLPDVPSSWEAVPVTTFDDQVTGALPVPRVSGAVVSERTPGLLNYWLRCPIADMYGYLLRHQGQVAGYFLLSAVPPAGRVADLWVASDQTEFWKYGYALAFREVSKLPGVLHSEAMTGDPLACSALRQMNLREMGGNQVFLLDPDKTLPAETPIALSMTDYDAFYH
jgi:hypothetical protein